MAGTASAGMMMPITAGFDLRALLEVARVADRAGVPALGIGEFAGTEAMALAGAVAAVTDRAVIETGVVSVLTRSPVLLAMGAATLQHVAGGEVLRLVDILGELVEDAPDTIRDEVGTR